MSLIVLPEFEVVLGSHYFTVKNMRAHIYKHLNDFSKRYIVEGLATPGGGTRHHYYGYICEGSEWRFHLGQYRAFVKYMRSVGIERSRYIENINPLYEADDVDLPLKDWVKPRDYQIGAVEFITEPNEINMEEWLESVHNDTVNDKDLHTRFIAAPTGTGKEQPVYCNVLTTDGFKPIGMIKVGDQVLTPKGTSTTVIGVFPQGVKPNYIVCFGDLRETEAGAEHYWQVYVDGVYQTITTLELRNRLNSGAQVEIDFITRDILLTPDEDKRALEDIEKGYLDEDKLESELSQAWAYLYTYLRNYDFRVHRGSIVIENNKLSFHGSLVVDTVRAMGGYAYEGVTTTLVNHPRLEEILKGSVNESKLDKLEPIRRLELSDIVSTYKSEMVCIAVEDEDRLYITDDYIITRNTVMASMGVSKIGKRLAIMVLPKYMDKWVEDITNIFKLTEKDIGYIGSQRGSSSSSSDILKGLISLKDTPKKIPPVLIISLVTYRNFTKAYEDNPKQCRAEYGLVPDEFFKALGVGVLVTDETHEHLHSVFKVLTHTHVPRVIPLSGTMISDDPRVESMQKIMFPKSIRYEDVEMLKYIQVYAVSYIYDNLRKEKITTKVPRSKYYNHSAYEESILKNPKVLKNYLKLIDEVLQDHYIKRRKPGQKVAIYMSRIDMCTVVTEYLAKKYEELDVRRYCEDDPYVNVIEPDIRVTTHLSAGTALDIENLITVIQTVSVSSSVANNQNLGRLRKIDGVDVHYVYLFCELIQKQVEYHFKRIELFRPKVASIANFRASTIL